MCNDEGKCGACPFKSYCPQFCSWLQNWGLTGKANYKIGLNLRVNPTKAFFYLNLRTSRFSIKRKPVKLSSVQPSSKTITVISHSGRL